MGSSELIPYFALLAHAALSFHKLSLCQPMRFLTFTLLILSPILLGVGGGGEQAAVWSLADY